MKEIEKVLYLVYTVFYMHPHIYHFWHFSFFAVDFSYGLVLFPFITKDVF